MKKRNMRLYGKCSTEEKITNEVVRLLLGDTVTGQYPLPVSEVAITLGYTKRTIYNYVRKAVKNNLLEYGKNGNLVIPSNRKSELGFRQFDKNHQIVKDPLIAEWKQDLLTRKQGEPLGSWRERIVNLERLCNNCKIKPSDLLISNKETEKIVRNFVTLYREGKV
ncbi:MAG: helix-turn-helix domain-containing protein, partial [Nitrosopumilaceae archaeon]